MAGMLEGPVALLIRAVWHAEPWGRYAAASCFLLGALMSRYAWIWAGRESSHDTATLFAVERGEKGVDRSRSLRHGPGCARGASCKPHQMKNLRHIRRRAAHRIYIM